jgi:hypothetical protein
MVGVEGQPEDREHERGGSQAEQRRTGVADDRTGRERRQRQPRHECGGGEGGGDPGRPVGRLDRGRTRPVPGHEGEVGDEQGADDECGALAARVQSVNPVASGSRLRW